MSAHATKMEPIVTIRNVETTKESSEVFNAQSYFDQGKELYGKDFEKARQLLLQSVHLEFQELGMVEPEDLYLMDSTILQMNKEVVVSKVAEKGFTDDQCLLLATTLRWLGHCYQNIDQYSKNVPEEDQANQERIKRFHAIYETAESLLQDLVKKNNSPKFKEELAELYYNSWPFMHSIEHPEDDVGASKHYQLARENNPSKQMEARSYNMESKYLFNAAGKEKDVERKKELKAKAFATFELAFGIYSSIPPEGRDEFLYYMYHNNYGMYCLDEQFYDRDKAYAMLLITIKYVMRAPEKDYHPYFPLFYVNYAQVLHEKGENEEALTHLKKAFELFERNPNSYLDQKKRAEKLLAKITN